MTFRFHRNALFAALLALGLAGTVDAQTSGGSSSTTPGGSAASQGSKGPGTGTTGMDKGAGSSTAKSADTKASGKAADVKSALSAGERRFMETAARHGMAEVQLGKMAQDKAQDQQVKDFGRRMAEDHGKANDQLKQLASAKGVTLPAEPDAKHKRLADRLGKLSGGEFDRAYMKEMVDDHEKDVREFRDMAKSAKDTEVRAFASTNLPVLEEHLKMAQSVHSAAAKPGAKGGSAARSGTAGGMASSGSPTGGGTPTAGSTAAGTTPPGGAASGGASAGGTAPAGTAGSVTSGTGTSGSTGTAAKSK